MTIEIKESNVFLFIIFTYTKTFTIILHYKRLINLSYKSCDYNKFTFIAFVHFTIYYQFEKGI
jgi:hypothetical protein